jgi:phosphoribosylglycinamide formyltransferase-1
MMKLAVMASGTGSIFEAMLKKGVTVDLLLADRPCRALEIAKGANIPSELIDRTEFGWRKGIGDAWTGRRAFTEEAAARLQSHGIELIGMSGFMMILDDVIFEHFWGKLLNIHPSLLPLFRGEHAVRDALAARVEVTGSTVHIATEVLDDHRFVIDQVEVPVLPGDDEDRLWARIKVEQWEQFPTVIQDIQSERIDLDWVTQNPYAYYQRASQQ